MKIANITISLLGVAALAACTTTPRAGPAEVTTFVAPATTSQLGQGTIFIENAPSRESGLNAELTGEERMDPMRMAEFKSAVARELARAGYREVPRDQAAQIAQVRLDRYVSRDDAPSRSPVSVGVGGSTGSYGSGVGLGIGINLGGANQARETVDTELGVMIRDRATMATLWEGRASFGTDVRHGLADPGAGANALAGALFSRFPEATSEPVIVELTQE